MSQFDDVPRFNDIPLPGGGGTHIHPYGKGPNDFTVTTTIPIGDSLGAVKIRDNPFDSGHGGNNIGWEP